MPKKKTKKRFKLASRDLLFYGIAFVLIVAGSLILQRRASDERRAELILQERQTRLEQAEEAVENPCQTGESRLIVLKGALASPSKLTVKKCDVMTIRNDDPSLVYNMNFGEHDNHLSYPGYTAQDLAPGKTQTFVASMLGTYLFHDHHRDQAHVELTVSE